MAGKGYVRVSRDALSGPAAERLLFLELCARASVKKREVLGVGLLRGQVLASTRELGEAIGKCPAFVLRHLRKLQAAGLVEMLQVTLPRPVNRSKIRLLLTVTNFFASGETSGVKSETSRETSREGMSETSQTADNALTTNGVGKTNSEEKIATKTASVTSGVTSGVKSVTSGRLIPIIRTLTSTISRNNGLEIMDTTTSSPPSASVAAEEARTEAGKQPRRASRGRLTRHDGRKSNGEGEKRGEIVELEQLQGAGRDKPENAPQNAKTAAGALEAEIRGLMADDRVRLQLRAKSGGMDEATAAALVPEFAGQMELEGKEEHGMRLAMHFAYWLGKKKVFLENQQKRVDERQKRAEADRRDFELLYNYMRS